MFRAKYLPQSSKILHDRWLRWVWHFPCPALWIKDPSRSNFTNKQNSPVKQNWTTYAIFISFEIYNVLKLGNIVFIMTRAWRCKKARGGWRWLSQKIIQWMTTVFVKQLWLCPILLFKTCLNTASKKFGCGVLIFSNTDISTYILNLPRGWFSDISKMSS